MVKVFKKYVPVGKGKSLRSEIDMAVVNPKPKAKHNIPFVIKKKDIGKITKAIIKVKGWHTECFSASVLKSSPRIFNFVKPGVIKEAEEFFDSWEFQKILVVPSIPHSKQSRDASLEIFKSKGIDGIIEFKTILSLLTDMAVPTRNYFESDNLQLIRLFKVYDMLKLGQMELFTNKRKRKKK